jgi:hypothetical protein
MVSKQPRQFGGKSMDKRTALGYFWYNKIQQRPFYSTYTLKKGKKKGWLRVEYLDEKRRVG